MSMHARVPSVALWAPLLLIATCGAGRPVLPGTPSVSVVGSDSRPAPDHRRTVEEVAGVLERDLGLRLPKKLVVHVYDSVNEFREGLTRDAHIAPAQADELALFAIGLARTNRAYLNARASKARPEWLRLIAHELTHVAQFELAGGEGHGEQWLIEGVAEHA